jgi:hypothetical protein
MSIALSLKKYLGFGLILGKDNHVSNEMQGLDTER